MLAQRLRSERALRLPHVRADGIARSGWPAGDNLTSKQSYYDSTLLCMLLPAQRPATTVVLAPRGCVLACCVLACSTADNRDVADGLQFGLLLARAADQYYTDEDGALPPQVRNACACSTAACACSTAACACSTAACACSTAAYACSRLLTRRRAASASADARGGGAARLRGRGLQVLA